MKTRLQTEHCAQQCLDVVGAEILAADLLLKNLLRTPNQRLVEIQSRECLININFCTVFQVV